MQTLAKGIVGVEREMIEIDVNVDSPETQRAKGEHNHVHYTEGPQRDCDYCKADLVSAVEREMQHKMDLVGILGEEVEVLKFYVENYDSVDAAVNQIERIRHNLETLRSTNIRLAEREYQRSLFTDK